MGTHSIFIFMHFTQIGGKMNATHNTQIASQMHFPQMYIKQVQCCYSLEGN